jgi:hypothetical protein
MDNIEHHGTLEAVVAEVVFSELAKKRFEVTEQQERELYDIFRKPLMDSQGRLAMLIGLKLEKTTKRVGMFWNRRTVPAIYVVDAKLIGYNKKGKFFGYVDNPMTFLRVLPLFKWRQNFLDNMDMWKALNRGIYPLHQEHNDYY